MSKITDRAAILFELIAFAEFQAKRKFLCAKPSASEAEISEFLDKWYCDKQLQIVEGETQIRAPTELSLLD